MGLQLQASVENAVGTQLLSGKETVSGAEFIKENDAKGPRGHKMTHHSWFPWKKSNCK